MQKKAIALLTASLLAAAAFSGCGSTTNKSSSGGSAKTTLVFFNGSAELVKFWNSFFSKYNASNSDGIKVEQQYSKESANTLQVKMASGDVPDIISTSVTQDMIDNHKFVDLTDKSWWNELSEDMKTDSVDAKSGKVYCVPLLKTQVGLIYNKTIFKKLGLEQAKTWKDFVSNLKTIKSKNPNIVPLYIGGKDSWMLSQMAQFTMMSSAMQSLGNSAAQTAMQSADFSSLKWDTTTSGALNTYASALMELQKDGLVNSDIVTATYDNQVEAFASGKAAFITQGLWAVSEIASKTKDTSFVGMTYYPSLVDDAKPAIGSAPDCDIYLASESKNVSAAEKVLDYIMQPENLKSISEAKSEPSSDPDVSSDWGVLKDDVAAIAKDDSIAKLNWAYTPSGFSSDDQGRTIQQLFADAYKTPADFSSTWIAAWKKGVGK